MRDAARNPRRYCPWTSNMKRGWTRERGTPPNVQTRICGAYDEEVVAADANLSAPADSQRAQEQLVLAKQYPGRERSLPSGAKVVELDAVRRFRRRTVLLRLLPGSPLLRPSPASLTQPPSPVVVA